MQPAVPRMVRWRGMGPALLALVQCLSVTDSPHPVQHEVTRLPGAVATYRARLEEDPHDPAALSGLSALLDMAVECSNSTQATGRSPTPHSSTSLLAHADAELALWDGDWDVALRHSCMATRAANHSRSQVCLGHSLAAERSGEGAPYATMASRAARSPLDETAWLADSAPPPSKSPVRLVGRARNLPTDRPMLAVYRQDQFLSPTECEALLSTAARGTWRLAAHTPYPTADSHISDLSTSSVPFQRWVGGMIAHRLYPLLCELYSVPASDLWLKELVVIKYIAGDDNASENRSRSQGGPAPDGVQEHRDASVISFNVLLSAPTDFDGGGTAFSQLVRANHDDGEKPEEDGVVVLLDQGGVVVHGGKLLHSGLSVRTGSRYVLAGFVQRCATCPE